ncbi:oligosaccharide flippase family protein [Paraglaciecola agarilytica]|nr:oligosaccharide flippase family protein [Paraglaciecola agarilytica]
MTDKLLILGGGLLVYVVVSNFLGPVNFGKIAFGVALATLPITISQWGANHVISNMAIIKRSAAIKYIRSTERFRSLIFLIVTLFIFIVLILTDKYKEDAGLILLVLVAHFHSGIDISQYYFNSRLESKVNAISSFISKFLSMSMRLLFVYFGANVIYFFLPYLVNNYVSYKLRITKLPKSKLNSKRYNKAYFTMGKGFVLTAFFTIIYSKVNEILLVRFFDYSYLAIFNVSLTLAFAWSFIPTAFGTSYITKAIDLKPISSRVFSFAFVNVLMVIISIPILLFIYFYSTDIVTFLFEKDYYKAAEILPVLSVSCLFSSLGVINNRIIGSFKGGSKYLYRKVIFCSVFSLILGYFMIGRYGLFGASYALFLTELLSLTLGNYFFKSGLILTIHLQFASPSFWRTFKREGLSHF